MGFCINNDEAEEIIKEATGNSEDYFDWDLEKNVFGLDGRSGIADLYDSRIFGLDVQEMKEDETVSDFRKRVFEMIKYPGVELENIRWYVDGGNL